MVLDAELLVPHWDNRKAGVRRETYGVPDIEARPEPPHFNEDRGDPRHQTWLRLLDVAASAVALAGIAILAILAGRLHVRSSFSRVMQ
jgi:hypothetical protein